MLVTGLDDSAATRELIARSGVPCVHLMELPQDSGQSLRGLPDAPYLPATGSTLSAPASIDRRITSCVSTASSQA
jgi:hypothetical protein